MKQNDYPDALRTVNMGVVRLSKISPNTELEIKKSDGSIAVIRAYQIKLNKAILGCGHEVEGIALACNMVKFCDHEDCRQDRTVSKVK